MQIWLEIITSRDAKSACFKGSRTSCREIIFGIFWPNFGRKRSHHVMDASCRHLSQRRLLFVPGTPSRPKCLCLLVFFLPGPKTFINQPRNHPHHLAVNSDHGLSFAGEKTRPWSEFPFLYRFTVLLNSGGSNSPWSEFWSEFPHFMGMGVVPAPSIYGIRTPTSMPYEPILPGMGVVFTISCPLTTGLI